MLFYTEKQTRSMSFKYKEKTSLDILLFLGMTTLIFIACTTTLLVLTSLKRSGIRLNRWQIGWNITNTAKELSVISAEDFWPMRLPWALEMLQKNQVNWRFVCFLRHLLPIQVLTAFYKTHFVPLILWVLFLFLPRKPLLIDRVNSFLVTRDGSRTYTGTNTD